jgi:hypothetical protein
MPVIAAALGNMNVLSEFYSDIQNNLNLSH